MIDDDFDKIVRHMFERFFNGNMMGDPERNVQIRFGTGPAPSQTGAISQDRDESITTETIDLENQFIIMAQGVNMDVDPVAHVEGREVILNVGMGIENEMRFELPYAIDTESSSMSFNNGVIEILLPRMSDIETSSDTNEVTLRAE